MERGLQSMKIDLNCPVELWQYDKPNDKKEYCHFVLGNIGDKTVVSVQVTLACYTQNDMFLFKQTERVRGLRAKKNEPFSIAITPNFPMDSEVYLQLELTIEKVWFEDGIVWRKGTEPLTTYTSNAMNKSRELDQLRFIAGNTAMGYPKLQENVWVCVCGRANRYEETRCQRCKRNKDTVFALYNQEVIKQAIQQYEKRLQLETKRALENNSVISKEKEEYAEQKRKRRTLQVKLGLSAFCAVAVILVFLLWGLPTINYNNALSMLKNNRYNEARVAFDAMGDYRDSKTQLLHCDYIEATCALNEGTQTSLQKSITLFGALNQFSDSANMLKEARYSLGMLYLQKSQYELAAEQFQLLGDYQDAETQIKEATYRQAVALIEGNPTLALVLFQGLNDYRDSPMQAQECIVIHAKALKESGEYLQAFEEFGRALSVAGAELLQQESAYAYATQQYEANDLAVAGQYYKLAGDYGDAVAKGNECIYQVAMIAKENQDYAKATELFLQVYDYLDSNAQFEECLIAQADMLKKENKIHEAIALLESIPDNEKANKALKNLQYQEAEKFYQAEDYSQAEILFSALGTYQNSVSRLRLARYALAEADFSAGEYEKALERYEKLGDYKDCKKKVQQCQYQLAENALNENDYTSAITYFEKLGTYKDSKEQYEVAVYNQAEMLHSQGKEEEAIALLATISNNETAKSRREEIILAQAEQLFLAKSYEQAAQKYVLLKQVPEAVEGYKKSCYLQGQILEKEGKWLEAANFYVPITGYEDATNRALQCYDQLFGDDISLNAYTAMEEKNYQTVVELLKDFPTENIPADYKGLPELYQEACYQWAEALYEADKPYEALPLYLLIPEYKTVTSVKLNRKCYQILGEWESETGLIAKFYADGTCDISGKKSAYRVKNTNIYIEGVLTYSISALTDTGLTFEDLLAEHTTVYKCTRTSEADMTKVLPLY